MPAALVIIQKSLGGKTWTNTHCVTDSTGAMGIPSDATLTTWGMAAPLTDANTSTAPTNFIQRLIAFERLMYAPDVLVTKAYMTDGRRAAADPTATVYAILTCSLAGRSAMLGAPALAGNVLEPGAIALMVHRNGVGFSHKPGRIFFRGALIEAQVKIGGPRLIDWESAAQRDATAASLNTAITSSALNTHFSGGTNVATGLYCVPRYQKTITPAPVPNINGQLNNAFAVTGMDVAGPVIRQVQKGRKRKAA